MSGPRVLGINSAHDAAACLLVDGEVVVAIPEERLTRLKHHEGFPHRAVSYCLLAGGLGSLADVDIVVLNEYVQTDFGLDLRRAGFEGELLINPSHHLLHAYYAWIASGFPAAAILIMDGAGYNYGEYVRRGSPLLGPPPPYSEMEEMESLYAVEHDDLRLIEKHWGLWDASRPYYRFPSLGHMFSMASQYIFGHWSHAGKTMGLAPYGDASRFPEPFIEYGPNGIEIDTEWITRLPQRSQVAAHLDPTCRDLAAKVQAELERAVVHLCRRLHELTGLDRLCVSGGVGLNSVANGLILRETPFAELFVTPAAGDSGIAIGAALYGYHHGARRRRTWSHGHNFHGRRYRDDEIWAAVDELRSFLRCERVADPAEACANDVVEGKVVGWFEGASEFGPRALGHRSIVCDARRPEMRDRLNEVVKFREPFRPYAASVLAERAREFFELLADDPFMMIVAPIIGAQRKLIPSVCHVDDTCRVQTVDADFPGSYRRMIEAFFARTGTPLVLNTSFNIRGEPIVETPGDALQCFLGCNMDLLYMHDLRIEKAIIDSAEEWADLVPSLTESSSLGATLATRDGAALAPKYYWERRTGHRTPIGECEWEIAQLVDGRRTIGELAAMVPRAAPEEIVATLATLQRDGLVAMRMTRESSPVG